MTILQQAITIILCALGTMLTRFLPFLVFNPKKPTPKYIQYLGSALPGAIFGMLVVYCLRNVDVLHFAYGPARAHRHRRDDQPAPVEETNAALHRGRHGVLYAAGAVRVLILISTERKMFPCACLT